MYLRDSRERIKKQGIDHILCGNDDTAESKAESTLLMKIHQSIRHALRQVMVDKSFPAEAQQQAEELLKSLLEYIDREKTERPCSDRLAFAERENAMDRLWMLFEDEQLHNLKAIRANGVDFDNESHRLTADASMSVILAELIHRSHRRLVEQLEVKISELR